MSEPIRRRHGLEALVNDASRERAGTPGARLFIRGDLGHINLRGNPAKREFVDGVAEALGQPLPTAPNTTSSAGLRVFWLGPDEWLIASDAAETAALAAQLEEATRDMHASVNDISGGQIALLLEGDACRNILARGCTLDLHASVFTVGACAQSGLGKAGILLSLVDDAPTFMIVVRRSFSDYLCRWLLQVGSDIGVALQEFRDIG